MVTFSIIRDAIYYKEDGILILRDGIFIFNVMLVFITKRMPFFINNMMAFLL